MQLKGCVRVSRIGWYYERLKAMSPAEVVWRIGQKKEEITRLKRYEKKDHIITQADLFGDHSMALSDRRFIPEAFYVDLWEGGEYFKSSIEENDFEYADMICEGRVIIFGKPVKFEDGIDWMSAFSKGMRWPLEFSPKLDFRQRDDIGDARVNWELGRHFETTVLARAFYLSGKSKYLEVLKENFYDWTSKNPFMKGISWTSPMEMAIRAYSWMWTYAFLHASFGDSDDKLLKDLKCALLNQVEYVMDHRSRYSSANNHLIVEMSIVCICAVVFGIKKWMDESIEVLAGEIKRQVHYDGVDKEQAVHYHSFVIEAYMLCIALLKKNSIKYPRHIDGVLDKMCLFLRDLMDSSGNVVEIGDSDDGRLLDLYAGGMFNHYEYVLQACSILLGKGYVQMERLQPNIKWIFEQNQICGNIEKPLAQKSTTYEIGGYTLIRGECEAGEVLMTFDHGELGYGAIAAHGHADALSITLRLGGRDVIIDPGTYVYHTKREWRDYFRKTINHSTVELGGKDQSDMKGEFIWGERANVQLLEHEFSENEDFVSARHDGYAPLMHQRDIHYKKPARISITDRIYGGEGEWIITFMLSSGVKVVKKSQNVVQLLIDENTSAVMEFESDCDIQVHLEEAWESKRYMEKVKTTAIRCKGKTDGNQIVRTHIDIGVGN